MGVVGRIGSGKSTLIKTFCNFLFQRTGSKVEYNGKIAYISQNPLIIDAGIKENIVFGHEYDAKKYKSIVEGCQLNATLLRLQGGDSTLIGKGGMDLSQGDR